MYDTLYQQNKSSIAYHTPCIIIIIIIISNTVNMKAGRRLLLLECQSSIFILGLCDFFGLVLFSAFFRCIISPSEPIKYCVTIKYPIIRIMCSSAYISTAYLEL